MFAQEYSPLNSCRKYMKLVPCGNLESRQPVPFVNSSVYVVHKNFKEKYVNRYTCLYVSLWMTN